MNPKQSQQPEWMHLDNVGAKGREVHRLVALQNIGRLLEIKPVRIETKNAVGWSVKRYFFQNLTLHLITAVPTSVILRRNAEGKIRERMDLFSLNP